MLDSERLGKDGCLGKISCEQMPIAVVTLQLSCIVQLIGHEVHRFNTSLCQGVSEDFCLSKTAERERFYVYG